MGAQTSNRLVQFQKRFAEWDDPTGSTPAYHYGTHYSSAMIVASYLVRTEPFTQVFLRLQVNIEEDFGCTDETIGHLGWTLRSG